MSFADPNLPYVLIALGLIGVCYEFCAPGSVLPGTAGGVLFVVGLYNLTRITYSGVAILTVTVFGIALLLGVAARARHNKSIDLLHEVGTAQTELNLNGKVLAAGRVWDARSVVAVPAGTAVIVTAVRGLSLEVAPR